MLTITFIYISLLYFLKDKFKKNTLLFLSSVPLLIIIWTRFGIGADYFSYEDMYTRLGVQSLSAMFSNYVDIEVGYKLIMYPFRALNIPFFVYLGIINSAATLLLFKWISDNSEDDTLSILLFYSMFFFVWILSAIRQSISLSVGLYFLFNKKKDIGLKKSIMLILMLSLIHRASLILLVFLLLREFKWTQKRQMAFMGLSLVSTFLPLAKLLAFFSFVPGVTKVIQHYLKDSYVFYDFPGLIRLAIFAVVILFYNKLKDKKKIVDPLLYGFSIYFLLKFSEITASRATIYTFFLLIIVVPEIINLISINRTKVMKIAISTMMVSFSFVYYLKEYRTMYSQSEYLPEVSLFTFANAYNSDFNDFGKTQSFYTNIRLQTNDLASDLKDVIVNKKTKKVEDTLYQTIEIDEEYMFLTQSGAILEIKNAKKDDRIVEGILVTKEYEKGYFFSDTALKDLLNEDRSQEMMKEVILNDYENQTFERGSEKVVSKEITSIPEEMIHFYPDMEGIDRVIMNQLNDGDIEYYIIRVDYKGIRSFIYLDSKMNPMIPVPVQTASRYNNKGFLSIYSHGVSMIFNKNGEIIYIGGN